MTTVADALEYFARGWAVIPIRCRTKVSDCRWSWWQSNRPCEATVRKWFRKSGQRNIATILGPVSGGLICRDFDKREAYEAWAAEHRELASSLPTVEAMKGRHVYCRGDFRDIENDADIRQRNFVSLGNGELRLHGCYCLLPPSIHPSGSMYRWLIPAAGLRRFSMFGKLASSRLCATERNRDN